MKNVFIVILIVVVIAVAYWKLYGEKESIVKQIFAKYTDPKSAFYKKDFDASREKLLKLDVKVLKEILSNPNIR